MIGQTLSHFRITAKLGEGGMGEVYRAEDTKLGREVAIKVLPEAFVADPDRLARFEREAKVLASLNHPHVAGIHEVGEEEGTHYLVMELAPGETLAERIARGPLAVDEVIPIALQIARGLEAAHERGIVHRDLKPGNVMVDDKGGVKILDFGLAKALEPEPGSRTAAEISRSPTMTYQATAAGVLLGTAAYMSPEQARGEEADRRADIWSFGVVLWEMLTGRKLFEGRTVSDTLAGILRDEIDVSKLSPDCPRAFRRLLRRCLERDPDRRLHDIADARIEIDEIRNRGPEEEPVPVVGDPPALASQRVPWLLLALVIGLGLALAFVFLRRPPAEPTVPTRFTIRPAEQMLLRSTGQSAAPVAVSPDGRRLVYGVIEPDGRNRLWLRSLDSVDARPLAGTERATRPFWSPDGRSIGFFSDRKLMTLELAGGLPLPIADVGGYARGGAWGPGGTIVYSPHFTGGLMRVPAEGGEPEPLTVLDEDAGEASHRYPSFLPHGEALVFLVLGEGAARTLGTEAESRLDAVRLDTGERHALVTGAANGVTAGAELLFYKGGRLLAQPLDPDRLELGGEPRVVVDGVMYDALYERAVFSVGGRTLVYQPGSFRGESQLTWIDATGKALGTLGDVGLQDGPSISPDGRRAAWIRAEGDVADLWLAELETGATRRLTVNRRPVWGVSWSSDGRRLAYAAMVEGKPNVFVTSVEEGSTDQIFEGGDFDWVVSDWSPDDGSLILTRDSRGVWTFDMNDPEAQPVALDDTIDGIVLFPTLSPDGRWLALASDLSGRWEVYVSSFPPGKGRWTVSNSGGTEPVWSSDGGSLYFRTPGNALYEADIEVARNSIRVGETTLLFHAMFAGGEDQPKYDVTEGGERFLVDTLLEEEARIPITVVLDWKSPGTR